MLPSSSSAPRSSSKLLQLRFEAWSALPLPLATLRAIDAHDGFLFVPVDSLNGRERMRGAGARKERGPQCQQELRIDKDLEASGEAFEK